MTSTRGLLIGYGNPGRGDDGVGPAFAQAIADKKLPGLSVDIDFQLTAEHSLTISRYDLVVFADAVIECDEPFLYTELASNEPTNLGTHSVTPQTAVTLSQLLFSSSPHAFLMGITGEHFDEIKEGLSATAQSNLLVAVGFFTKWYQEFVCPMGK